MSDECVAHSRGGYPVTPDGRYFVVRARLWRTSDPALSEERRGELVRTLMGARSRLRTLGGDNAARECTRRWSNDAKVRLGERGPVWWSDGAPDYNRRMVKNTPYAAWYESLLLDNQP